MKRIGKNSIFFEHVYLKATGTAGGRKEAEGPIGELLDKRFKDNYCQEKTWEKAEIRLLDEAIKAALSKGRLLDDQIDLVVGGDLNNQIAITNYELRDYEWPYLGVFAACSTLTEGIITGGAFLEAGFGENIMCVTSSHNATSERQFRYPTEYGGQKPESMTFTATLAGAGILSKDKSLFRITRATMGRVIDMAQKDPQDMGRAMAPAAADTFFQHLKDFDTTPNEYDLILTGDLSKYGGEIFDKICAEKGYDVSNIHQDAGTLIYDIDTQQVFAGGSGCGCVTFATYCYITDMILKGAFNKVLIIATGALLNPIMVAQKESVPCIAHAICIERGAV